jgi:hypothetical protein
MTKADSVLSTPPLNSSSNNVIEFPFGVSRKEFARKSRASKKGTRDERVPKPGADLVSVTAGNSRLRLERRDAIRTAEAATRYWRVRLEFEDAVSCAQREGLPEGRFHPDVDPADRYPMVGKYRAALVRQLLTPAWDANSVIWKQTTFAKGQHKHTDANPKKIEKAIADDLAWLAAHPTRRTGNSEACAKRRAFNEAMRHE